MRDVPDAADEAFFAGRRTEEIPFVVNDSVDIVDGPYTGRSGSVISIETIKPEATLLVELADGKDVIVPLSILRLSSDDRSPGPKDENTPPD